MSKRQDNTYTGLPEEFDKHVRPASFFLYTRPLNDAVLRESNDISLHHWSLVAVFVDESFRTMEANDVNGDLMPFFYKQTPKYTDGGEVGTFYELVPVITSPLKLHKATKNNSLNGTRYRSLSNNCQCWVKELAGQISWALKEAVSRYRSCREVPLTETLINCSWASSVSSTKSTSRSLINASRSQMNGSVVHEHIS